LVQQQSKPPILSWLTLFASLVSLLMLILTAAGALPAWAIFLVPFWIAILCYLHLDQMVGLVTGSADH
jgi:hypothetical protein